MLRYLAASSVALVGLASCQLFTVPGLGSITAQPEPAALVKAAESVSNALQPERLTPEQRAALIASLSSIAARLGYVVLPIASDD